MSSSLPFDMGTLTSPALSARRRQHAGRTSRAARAGMVLAVVAVTATVGIGTWVLGSGADAAPRRENTVPTLSDITRSEPPLSIAPPPKGESKKAKTAANGKAATKSTSASAR